MRTAEQMQRRLTKDRADLQRGGGNAHYNNMKRNAERLLIEPQQLHVDDGKSELNPELIFDWRSIYFAPAIEERRATAGAPLNTPIVRVVSENVPFGEKVGDGQIPRP